MRLLNILVVQAHPEPQSFCASMALTAIDVFRNQGHKVRVSDLYAMRFNPVASADDFEDRKNSDYLVYALEQRNALETESLAPDIKVEIGKVLWSDLIIFNFPVYWCSMPAIMKGWIDRVFVSGLCYGGRRFYDQGGLRGKRAMLSVTIGGQQHMFTHDGIHGSIEDMLKPVLQGTLAYVGLEVIPPFVAWHVPYISEEARGKIMSDFRRYLQSIHTAKPMEFPSLQDFNQDMTRKVKTLA